MPSARRSIVGRGRRRPEEGPEGLGRPHLGVEPGARGEDVDPLDEAREARVRRHRLGDEVVGEDDPGAFRPGGAADEAHAALLERGQVEGGAVGPAHELERGLAAGDREVEDLVGRLVEDAHRVEPPQDVAPPVDARQPRVAADRERDRPARGVDLVGELDARGRGADDEDAALRELARGSGSGSAPPGRRRRAGCRANAGTKGVSQCPVAITTLGASQAPRSVVTRYPAPAGSTASTVVPSSTGARERARVALEEVDDLGHGSCSRRGRARRSGSRGAGSASSA